MSITKSLLFVAAIVATPAFAHGQASSLTPENIDLATAACTNGAAPIPILSDFGHETGNYAVPITDETGNAFTAVLIAAEDLDKVEACEIKLDRTEWAENEASSEDASNQS